MSLDDSTAQNPGTADEAQTAQNARKAVQDESTIFYLGEFNSGGTKVSLPILNKANIPQISPSNTYVGLTTDEPGSEPGEPDKYYPAQKRTYARIVPDGHDPGRGAGHDHEGGRLQVRPHLQRQDHVRRRSGDEHRDRREGQSASRSRATTAPTRTRRTTARSRRRSTADCFVGSGVTGENYVQVFKDVAAACPNCKLYGPDGVAEAAFTDPKEGGIPADVGARTKVTVATLEPEEFEKQGIAEAEKFFDGLQGGVRRRLSRTRTPSTATRRWRWRSTRSKAVGDKANDREAVRKQLLENTKGRDSVLGTYDIDENGDTTLTDYGLYTIKDGQLDVREGRSRPRAAEASTRSDAGSVR